MNLTVTDSLTTVAAALQLALKRQATGMEVIITAQNLKLFYVLTSLPLKRKKSFLILIPILWAPATPHEIQKQRDHRHEKPSSLKPAVSPIKMLSGFYNRAESCSQGEEALHKLDS